MMQRPDLYWMQPQASDTGSPWRSLRAASSYQRTFRLVRSAESLTTYRGLQSQEWIHAVSHRLHLHQNQHGPDCGCSSVLWWMESPHTGQSFCCRCCCWRSDMDSFSFLLDLGHITETNLTDFGDTWASLKHIMTSLLTICFTLCPYYTIFIHTLQYQFKDFLKKVWLAPLHNRMK